MQTQSDPPAEGNNAVSGHNTGTGIHTVHNPGTSWQMTYGRTCIIEDLDFHTKLVRLAGLATDDAVMAYDTWRMGLLCTCTLLSARAIKQHIQYQAGHQEADDQFSKTMKHELNALTTDVRWCIGVLMMQQTCRRSHNLLAHSMTPKT
jgi:hypothetical protein